MKSFLIIFLFFLPSFGALIDGYDGDRPQLNPSVLTLAQAQQLWNEFKALDYITYEYATDGCYARATALALYAEKKGYDMAKLFVEGRLIAKLDNNPYKDLAMWDWHVAPVLYIQNEGKLDLYVFDPSLFDKPALVDDWIYKMRDDDGYGTRGKIVTTYYGSKYQFMSKSHDKSARKKRSWLAEDLADTRIALVKGLAIISGYKKQELPMDKIEKIKKAIQ